MISIRMLKLFGDLIFQPLKLIFKSSLKKNTFASEQKKLKAVPVLKKAQISSGATFKKDSSRMITPYQWKNTLATDIE